MAGRFGDTRDDMSGYTDVGRIRQARWVEPDEGEEGRPTLVLDILPTILQGDNEATTEELFYGTAGIISHPSPATSDTDAAEAVFVDAGDRLVVGTRDLRFEVQPLEGETKIYALGKDKTVQATITLKPNGEIDVTGTTINVIADVVNLGSSGATKGVARVGDDVEINVAIGAFTDTNPVSGGDTSPLVPVTLTGTITSASSKVNADD